MKSVQYKVVKAPEAFTFNEIRFTEIDIGSKNVQLYHKHVESMDGIMWLIKLELQDYYYNIV